MEEKGSLCGGKRKNGESGGEIVSDSQKQHVVPEIAPEDGPSPVERCAGQSRNKRPVPELKDRVWLRPPVQHHSSRIGEKYQAVIDESA